MRLQLVLSQDVLNSTDHFYCVLENYECKKIVCNNRSIVLLSYMIELEIHAEHAYIFNW